MALRLPRQIDAVGFGGGRGLMHVTIPAFRELGWTSVAVTTTFGTGGSSQMLKGCLEARYGYTPSLGNLAASYQQALGVPALEPLFGYRIGWHDGRPLSLIVQQLIRGSTAKRGHRKVPPILLRRLEHVALAIGKDLRTSRFGVSASLPGHSIRNLLVLWECLRFGVFLPSSKISLNALASALAALQRFFGLRSVYVLPISVEPGVLVARYAKALSSQALVLAQVPLHHVGFDRKTLTGERDIEVVQAGTGPQEFDVEYRQRDGSVGPRPSVFPLVREAIGRTKFIVFGGGSFYTSILLHLAISGVIESLLERADIPRVLIINPYHLDQTVGQSVAEFVGAVEKLAHRVSTGPAQKKLPRRLAFEDLFTDIIVNDTVASAIDSWCTKNTLRVNSYGDPRKTRYPHRDRRGTPSPLVRGDGSPIFVDGAGKPVDQQTGILMNRYVYFLDRHPQMARRWGVTSYERSLLSLMDQPAEVGEARGALYLKPAEEVELQRRGIHVHRGRLVAEYLKDIKAPRGKVFGIAGFDAKKVARIFRRIHTDR